MRKRVLSAVLALSMLLGLSGCMEPKEESSSDRFFSTQVIASAVSPSRRLGFRVMQAVFRWSL